MAQNPLQKYFRQPKIYVKLPSGGVYNQPGTFQGDATNMPVYGMTGMDEIMMKTPDALLSGESTVKVIESCCPSIKNAWDVSGLDLDAILTAIRIATYGNITNVNQKCRHCETDNAYDIDLGVIVEHFSKCQYENTIVLKDLVIKTQPLNYDQNTKFSLRNFNLQQQLAQTSSIEDKEKQQEVVANLFKELSEIQTAIFTAGIDSIQVDGTVVTEKSYIKEWLENCDKEVFDEIKKQFNTNKDRWAVPPFRVKCENCGEENELQLDLDHSNFFATA